MVHDDVKEYLTINRPTLETIARLFEEFLDPVRPTEWTRILRLCLILHSPAVLATQAMEKNRKPRKNEEDEEAEPPAQKKARIEKQPKRSAETDQFQAKAENTLSDILSLAETSVFDNPAFQLCRCIMTLSALLIEVSLSHLATMCDSWDSDTRHEAFRAMNLLWEHNDASYIKTAPFAEWLLLGVEKLTNPPAMTPQPKLPITKKQMSQSLVAMTSSLKMSICAARRIQYNKKEVKSTDAHQGFQFLERHSNQGQSIRAVLKRATDNAKKLGLSAPTKGWLIRGLEDAYPNVRLRAAEFLLGAFRYGDIPTRASFNLPTIDLLHDVSDKVRENAVQSLIVLATSQPFKDGAYKRFETLIKSRKAQLRRCGLRLVSQCPTLNVPALKEAFRCYLTGMDDEFCLSEDPPDLCVKTAQAIVATNISKHLELCSIAMDSLQTPPTSQGMLFAFKAFCAALLCQCSQQCLSLFPPWVLAGYYELQRSFPLVFNRHLVILPLQEDAITFRVKGYKVLATTTRELPTWPAEIPMTEVGRSFIAEGVLTPAEIEEGMCLPHRSTENELFLGMLKADLEEMVEAPPRLSFGCTADVRVQSKAVTDTEFLVDVIPRKEGLAILSIKVDGSPARLRIKDSKTILTTVEKPVSEYRCFISVQGVVKLIVEIC